MAACQLAARIPMCHQLRSRSSPAVLSLLVLLGMNTRPSLFRMVTLRSPSGSPASFPCTEMKQCHVQYGCCRRQLALRCGELLFLACRLIGLHVLAISTPVFTRRYTDSAIRCRDVARGWATAGLFKSFRLGYTCLCGKTTWILIKP